VQTAASVDDHSQARVELPLPQWGMGMSEGTVLTWHKTGGATSPKTSRWPRSRRRRSRRPGVLGDRNVSEKLVDEGDTVELRTVVAVIETA
jgi:hypothetical protein